MQLAYGKTQKNKKLKNYNIKILLIAFAVIGLFVFASPATLNSIKNPNYITYQIDTSKSTIQWESLVHIGNIKINNGSISIISDRISSLNVNINMKSISNEDIENKLLKGTLENVLKSPDFFDVEAFPQAHFKLHTAKKVSENEYQVSGDFIIFESGICTDFKASMEVKGDSLFFYTEKTALDRTDWGIFYLSKNNLFPKEEEESMEVPDTLYITSKLVAFKSN